MKVTKVISLLCSISKKTNAERKNVLKLSYDLEILDELLTPNVHILLVKVDEKHIESIKVHPFVNAIEDQPNISL